jgi:hypothetical protein
MGTVAHKVTHSHNCYHNAQGFGFYPLKLKDNTWTVGTEGLGDQFHATTTNDGEFATEEEARARAEVMGQYPLGQAPKI